MIRRSLEPGRPLTRLHAPVRPGRPRATPLALEAAVFLMCCMLTWWVSAVHPNPIWSWLGLLEFGWLCFMCFRAEPRGFVLLLPIIVITRASVVVALISIEYGARLPELGIVGEAGPFTASYVIFAAVLFVSSLCAYRLIVPRERWAQPTPMTPIFDTFARPIALVVIALGVLTTLWLLALGAMRGFPLLLNMDRFVFRRVFADPLTVNILNCKAILAGALGLVSFAIPVSRTLKLGSSLCFALFIAVNFLFGDKFFIILSTACSFFAPYLYLNHQLVLRRLPIFAGATALLLVPVGGVTWFIYSDQGRATPEATAQKLVERFAAQGELWYLQSRVGAPAVSWDGDFIAKNIESMSVKQVDLFALRNGIGPAYFMNRYAPTKIRAAQMRNAGSVTYTMALEPLALALFGWIGLVAVLVVTGLLFAAGAAYLAYAIERRLILSMLFAGYVTLLLKSFSNQGGPWVIFSVYTLKWLSVVLLIEAGLLAIETSQARPRKSLARWAKRHAAADAQPATS